ncbi:MAG: DUF3417 domain-containing protein [Bryobacteraceae bacterium]
MDSEQLRTKLRELALDLRWSWNHAADELWIRLDPELWALTHNAWVILETVSRERLGACVADAAFRQQLEKAFRYYEYHNTRSALVSNGVSQLADHSGRALQHGIHAERRPANLLGWSRQSRRRSDESCQRPGCSGVRRWTSVSAGLFPSAHRRGRPSGGAVSL